MRAFNFIFAVLFFSTISAFAQSPVPEPDTLKTPVKQTDPTPQTTAPNVNYTQNKIKITSAELPEMIQRALESGPEYSGWERGDVYKDKAGKVYIIEVKDADRKRVFRFDKNGRPVND